MSGYESVVVVGIGQLGSVFAEGFLRLGRPVYPVTRSQRIADVAARAGDVGLVLVCTGESDLAGALDQLPPPLRGRVALVQNELLPRDWLRVGITRPSGVVVWFEKKAGRPLHVVRPSVAYGPARSLLLANLEQLGIGAYDVDESELAFELVLKNLYILVHNLAGLRLGGTVGQLWQNHEGFAEQVADDVLSHQQALLGHDIDRPRLIEKLRETVALDPQHACAGRTAADRLKRVLSQSRAAGLTLSTLQCLAAERVDRGDA